jgi:hypothetical protein|tara:strand:+ start:27 stop:1034 length:1008 start_codon:yes stop_codon:yes gene_type:complete
MAETFVRQAPYIEERSEQLLASVFGDPNAERRKDPNTGEFTEGLEDFNLRRFGRAGVSRQVPQYSIAGLNQDQIDAFQRTRQGLGGFAPFLQQAQGTLQSGVGAALAGTPFFAQGAQMLGQGATGITGQDISQYFNPYQAAVTDEIKRQGDIMKTQAASKAQQAGAFGGSRLGVVEAGIDEGTLRQIGQAQQSGFNQALANAQRDKQRQLMAGQGLGAIGSRFGQLGQGLGTLGAGQAGLGLDFQRAGLTDASSLLGIGGLQQQISQAGLDAARKTAEQQEMEPFTRLGFASDILTGQPSSYSSITYGDQAPPVNPLSQIAGLGIGALGLSRLFG